MNSQFEEKKGTYLLLLGLLFVLLIVIYFMFFQPLMKESKAKESELQQLESDIAILETELTAEENKEFKAEDIESLKVASRLPQSPELEQLILILEEIESVSSNRFENISFSYDGSVPERVVEDSESEDEGNGETTETTEEEETNEAIPEEEMSVIDMEEKPEKLQVMNINMNVIAPDYDHFQIFVQEIEKQNRMMMVSSMDFEKPGEQELLIEESPTEYISVNVNLVTFYYDEQHTTQDSSY